MYVLLAFLILSCKCVWCLLSSLSEEDDDDDDNDNNNNNMAQGV
jgi:hypothetical protein